MSGKFKPGDLAIITHATVMHQSIGACCELVQLLHPGDSYTAPDGVPSDYEGDTRSLWLVIGDSVVGRAWRYASIVETPGHALVPEEWLMPLRGDFEFSNERKQEVAHG